MRRTSSTLLVLLPLTGCVALTQASAGAEANVCSSFDWPLRREEVWFAAPDLSVVASGSKLSSDRPAARLQLMSGEKTSLPGAPSREPKPGSFSGYVKLGALGTTNDVQVTLSGEGWIDLVEEGGTVLQPNAHSGRKGCPTLRKSVRFPAPKNAFSVLVSNATAETVLIAVAPSK